MELSSSEMDSDGVRLEWMKGGEESGLWIGLASRFRRKRHIGEEAFIF